MPDLGQLPRDLMTLAQWDALELDPTRRWELSEGIPIMSPRPHPMHQRMAFRLTRLLEDAYRPTSRRSLRSRSPPIRPFHQACVRPTSLSCHIVSRRNDRRGSRRPM